MPRYVPKDRPSAQSFEVAGVRVDMARSSHSSVVVSSVTRDTAGTVMCEVRQHSQGISFLLEKGKLLK